MANKRFVNPKDIDEDLIRNLVDSAPDYKQTEIHPIQREEILSSPIPAINPILDYRAVFFKPNRIRKRVSFHLDAETKMKLNIIWQRLGDGQTNLPAFVDNILRHHLETFKDAINNLSKNHSDIL